MEADYKVSIIAKNLHLTEWTIEADYKVTINANNLHLTQWAIEADDKVSFINKSSFNSMNLGSRI